MTTRIERLPLTQVERRREVDVKTRFLDVKASFLVDDIVEALPRLSPEAAAEVNSHLERALAVARSAMEEEFRRDTRRIR